MKNPREELLSPFVELSEILTGVPNLDRKLGAQYLDRLLSTPFDTTLRQALEKFSKLAKDDTLPAQVKAQIVNDDSLRPTVCQIVLLWLTSTIQDSHDNPTGLRWGSKDEYFSALAWQIIGAHVPGLSGGYFGHWRYRPDNEPLGAS